MVGCGQGGYLATVLFTFLFTHRGVGSMYEGCDGARVRCIIGIKCVRVVGVHIQCNTVVDGLMVE